jgi:hypothetical protein
MDKSEAIERTIRHILGILRVWIFYFGLQSKFTRFFADKPDK